MKPSILIIGASSGIGKQTALTFSKNNSKVIACSRNFKLLNGKNGTIIIAVIINKVTNKV